MKSSSERALLCASLAALCASCNSAEAARARDAKPSCVACHAADYAGANHPKHVGEKPFECQVCHRQEAWHPSVLNHAWSLTGAHAQAQCSFCHGKLPGTYAGTPRECVGCHRDDYDRATYPGHDEFALTCADCHDTRAFKPATFVPPVKAGSERARREPSSRSTATEVESIPREAKKAKTEKARPSAKAKTAPAGTEAAEAPVAPVQPSPPSEPAPQTWQSGERKPDAKSGASRHRH
jgi:hypothetical protein